jgi:3-hydroxy acid dehydrogenase/malonic semialdehyde reductase
MASEQRVVLVTGGSSGFGRAAARRFLEDGDRVIVTARRLERVEALTQEFGDRVLPLRLDVRDRAAVAAGIDGLPDPFAAIDVLVNNAGLALGLDAAPEADLDQWDEMIDTNCKGLVYVARAVLPGMVERKRGLVINLGSIAGTYPYPGGNVYGATKAFVHQFSLNLRSDLQGTGVRVTSVEPGMSETEFSLVRFGGDAGRAAEVYEGKRPPGAASLPPHVNINVIEMMPTAQAFGALPVSPIS